MSLSGRARESSVAGPRRFSRSVLSVSWKQAERAPLAARLCSNEQRTEMARDEGRQTVLKRG